MQRASGDLGGEMSRAILGEERAHRCHMHDQTGIDLMTQKFHRRRCIIQSYVHLGGWPNANDEHLVIVMSSPQSMYMNEGKKKSINRFFLGARQVYQNKESREKKRKSIYENCPS